MSNPVKPGWPDPSALPFMLFGAQSPNPAAQPLAQGIAGGMDLIKNFWGNLPGGTAIPGFLVPTIDVEELDKRLSDLRAAESWLEVNLNMLRATIQGLEVQRHTIAAIQSLSAMAEARPAAPAPKSGGLPPGWPSSPPVAAPVVPEPPAAAAPPVLVESGLAIEPPALAAETKTVADSANPLLAGLAANNWLGFLQDQFSKVAQAALSTSVPEARRDVAASSPPPKTTRKSPPKKAAKKTARRRSAG